ncbi:hypothetical protein BH160DRAFT_0620 [Burkholderia sp. H160]|nr:hypothetical protein BH160DRAFT_0620 [Burkholderia sp. H160]
MRVLFLAAAFTIPAKQESFHSEPSLLVAMQVMLNSVGYNTLMYFP